MSETDATNPNQPSINETQPLPVTPEPAPTPVPAALAAPAPGYAPAANDALQDEPKKSRKWLPWLVGAGTVVAVFAIGGVGVAIGHSRTIDSPEGIEHVTVRKTEVPGPIESVVIPPDGTDSKVPVNPNAPTGTAPPWGHGHNGQHQGRHYDSNADIEIEDQSGDGRTVYIEEVRTSLRSAHVAIFTKSGEFLGSAPVSAGSSPVSVTLTKPLSASHSGIELIGLLYTDDGSGMLDLTRDQPICERDDDGPEIIEEDFKYWVQ